MVMPRLILFENVKGFTYAFDKKNNPNSIPYSAIVIEKLKGLGYDVCPLVIDFSKFGIPQRRKRFILVGVHKGGESSAEEFKSKLWKNREQFFSENKLPESPSVSDAISDLLRCNGEVDTPDRKGFKSGVYGKPSNEYQVYMRKDVREVIPQSHSFAHHSKEKIHCFENLLAYYPIRNKRIDGEEREKWGIHQRGLTVLDAQSIAPTITNMPDDYLHYLEPRIMTVRECARIQSFPDWYEIKEKYTTGGEMRKIEVPRYTQVGNAIPPLFAQQAGLVLKEML